MVAPLDGLKLQVRRREDGGVVVLHMKCGGCRRFRWCCRIVVMAIRGGCCYSSFPASCGGAKLDGDALVAAEMVKLRWRCAHWREGADSWLLVRGGSSEGGGGLWTLLVRE